MELHVLAGQIVVAQFNFWIDSMTGGGHDSFEFGNCFWELYFDTIALHSTGQDLQF